MIYHMPSTKIGVALIMPVHGPLSLSAPALLALAILSPAPEQIIIVTDVPLGKDDQLLLPPRAITVQVPYASGPAMARNAGAQAATTEVLLFVDADVVVPPDTVSRVTDEFDRQPGITALFGSYDATPGDPGLLSQYRNLMHHYVHQHAREEAGTFWGGLGAVKAGLFRAVGGFDASYRVPCIEDIELGCRLRDAGAEIRLVKSLQGCHLKRWTALNMLKTDLLQRGVPWMRLILARRQLPADLNTDRYSRWSVLLACSGTALLPTAGQGLPWALGLLLLYVAVIVLNLPFYRFLAGQRGAWFALCCIPWHLLYFLVCGAAALIGLLLHGRDFLRSYLWQRHYAPGK